MSINVDYNFCLLFRNYSNFLCPPDVIDMEVEPTSSKSSDLLATLE